MLTATVFLPVVGALIIALLPRERAELPRLAALLTTLATFALSIVLLAGFDPDGGYQFVNRADWLTPDVGAFTLQYKLGVDGISLPLVLLTTFLTLLSVLISWHITLRPKEYFAWLLVLETGVLGLFTSLDFILFFVFW